MQENKFEAQQKDVDVNDDDVASDSDDSDTLERMRAFSSANKKDSGSVRRYDEYANFLTRSQRAHILGQDAPPSPEEEKKRKLHFKLRGDSVDKTIHEVPELSEDDVRRCFMTDENWRAIDMDIQLTRRRWENCKSGKIPFDEDNNTLRGLESMFDNELMERKWMSDHEKHVINECNRQKRETRYPDWDQFRQASMITSTKDSERARKLAVKDAEEAVQCWQRTKTTNLLLEPNKRSTSIFKKILSIGGKSGKK